MEDNIYYMKSIGIEIKRPIKCLDWEFKNLDDSELSEEDIKEIIKILEKE